MEKDGEIIGQNIFVKTSLHGDDGGELPIWTMGPICITPELKRQGYGKILRWIYRRVSDSARVFCCSRTSGGV